MNTIFQKNMIALQTVLRKEIIRFMRIWTQTLLPPAITMTLYFIIFGKLIGAQIKDIQGYSYMQYIVPGLTMMSIMTSAYANTSSSFFSAKFSKSVEEMMVSSMPNYVILFGYTLGGAVRGLLVGVIVMGIGFLFTHIPIYHVSAVLSMAILSSFLFSLGGLLNGIFARKFDDVSFIPTFVLTPLTYLGGVFYSIHQLPELWQTLSQFNPVFIIVSTFKYGMLGTTDINVFFGFSMVCIVLLILFIGCLYLLEKGVGLKT